MAHLEEKFEGGVLTLTMNRPEARNAMSGEMMRLLEEAIPRAADDPEVRCLVLSIGQNGSHSHSQAFGTVHASTNWQT